MEAWEYELAVLVPPPRFLPCPRCPAKVALSDDVCMSCGEWLTRAYLEEQRRVHEHRGRLTTVPT